MDFLGRLTESGGRAVCWDAAIVFEQVPPSRTTLRFVYRRGLRDGAVAATRYRRAHGSSDSIRYIGSYMARKVGYAANHALWGVVEPGRIARALDDLGFAAGLFGTLIGRKFYLYGRRPDTLGAGRKN